MNHSLWKIYKRQPTHVRTIMTPSKQFLVFLIYVVLVLPTHNNTLKILFFQEFTVLKHGLFIISVWSFFQNRNKMDACSENSECLKASFERQLFICRLLNLSTPVNRTSQWFSAPFFSIFLFKINHRDFHNEQSSFQVPKDILIMISVTPTIREKKNWKI